MGFNRPSAPNPLECDSNKKIELIGEEERRVQMWELEQNDKTMVHATRAENAVEGPGIGWIIK